MRARLARGVEIVRVQVVATTALRIQSGSLSSGTYHKDGRGGGAYAYPAGVPGDMVLVLVCALLREEPSLLGSTVGARRVVVVGPVGGAPGGGRGG